MNIFRDASSGPAPSLSFLSFGVAPRLVRNTMMFPQQLGTLSLLCAFALISTVSKAEDAGTLKTEYFESAVNGARAINYKQWKTSRQGKVIVTREETALSGRGTFELISTIIFHDGHKILQLTSSLGKRLLLFQPQANYKALLVDSDSDGIYERIVIRDAQDRLIDSFTIAPDGRITPIPDAELQRQQELEQRERG